MLDIPHKDQQFIFVRVLDQVFVALLLAKGHHGLDV